MHPIPIAVRSFAIAHLLATSIPAQADAPCPPTLEQIRAVWKPGTTGGNGEWRVDSFDDDRLTISHASIQQRGRVHFTFQVGAEGSLAVLTAEHRGTPIPMVSRNHHGSGFIGLDALRIDMLAELKRRNERAWKRWHANIAIAPDAAETATKKGADPKRLSVGTRLEGRRTDRKENDQFVSKVWGTVTRHDARFFYLTLDEQWPGQDGQPFRCQWEWRFERDGVDADSGAPKWRVLAGRMIRGERPDQRSNWRGHVTWKDGMLTGRYGFDWLGMKSRGLPSGTDELTHPLVLSVSPASNASIRGRTGKDNR